MFIISKCLVHHALHISTHLFSLNSGISGLKVRHIRPVYGFVWHSCGSSPASAKEWPRSCLSAPLVIDTRPSRHSASHRLVTGICCLAGVLYDADIWKRNVHLSMHTDENRRAHHIHCSSFSLILYKTFMYHLFRRQYRPRLCQ